MISYNCSSSAEKLPQCGYSTPCPRTAKCAELEDVLFNYLIFCAKMHVLQIEKLKEGNEQLKQGKESAEKQNRAMSMQMVTSLDNYRKGLDDILNRNKAEFEESRKKYEEDVGHLRKQVCHTACLFTALHGMQTRSSDENSVCLSVCPSVCPSVHPSHA